MVNRKSIVCDCSSDEHQVILYNTFYENEPNLYLVIHLSSKPWYKRIIHAIKYIFGHRSCYGDFDEFVFNLNSAESFLESIDEYLTNMEHVQE